MRGDANHIQEWCHTWFGVGHERSGYVAGGTEVDEEGRSASLKEGVVYKADSQFNYRSVIDIHMRRGGGHILGLMLHRALCQSPKEAEVILREQYMMGRADVHLEGKALHPKQNHNLIMEITSMFI